MLAVLLGLLGIPFGIVAAVVGLYGVFALAGMQEDQGRRGLLAGALGVVPGAIGGFSAGMAAGRWITSGEAGWRGVVAGVVAGVLLASLFGVVGLVAGIRAAENRGVTNYAGERAAWGLLYVALPAAIVGGAAGYVIGSWLTGGA